MNLKILHIVQNYYPSKGGTQLLFQSISERLVKDYNDKVYVATTDSMYDPGSSLYQKINFHNVINGVIVHRFPFDRFWRKFYKQLFIIFLKMNFRLPLNFQKLMRVPNSKILMNFIYNFEANVICASSSNYLYMDYASNRFHHSKPKPFVFMGAIHFDDDNNTYVPHWVLHNILSSDLYIANTTYESERLVKIGVPHSKIRVVGCGVNPKQYNCYDRFICKHELGIHGDIKIIGYIGRFAPNKDIPLLIDAFSMLDKNTFLLLAGAKNAYLNIINRHIDNLDKSISKRIKVLVDIDENQKARLFASLDIFVSPSYSESFGIVFLEAWASKLPVIGANIGAIASVIDHGENGLLFEPRNKESLIQNINTYLNNEMLRITHAEAGFDKTLKNFTWDIIASKYRDIYIDAIKIFNKKMCGFTGVVSKNEEHPGTKSFMQYAIKDLYRRGPDEQSIWVSDDKKASLGFVRLAIRDLTSNGAQPMLSNNRRWVLMYNGETYNTDEIIDFANIDRSSLKGSSDTEIIITSIETIGFQETISKMDGIFAIAVLDQVENTLYLVRDHVGVKPLYFGVQNDGIVFSSNYHHVVNHPYFAKKQINADALVGYFKYGFVQAGEGLFEKTYLVPPAHITTINLQSFEFTFSKYYFTGKGHQGELGDVIERIVQKQLVSDVPVGTFLSGGIDSAIVTAYASRAQKNITAFTIGVNDPKLDESELSQKTAISLGLNHQIHQINDDDILSTIEQYDESLAEPLADYSSLLTLKVCELAKEKLTVVLSGDGGDELFWGYPRMSIFWKYYPFLRLPRILRFYSIVFAKLKGKIIPFRLLKFKNSFDYYLSSQGLTGNKEWLPLVLKNHSRKVSSRAEKQLKFHYANDIVKLVKNVELSIHLQRVLLKVDRASMYHSLEVRTPLLSPLVVAISNKYNYSICFKDGVGKQPLRDVLKNIIQVDEVLASKKKGFEPPMANWLRNELKETVKKRLFSIPLFLKPHISSKGVEKMWEDHQSFKIDNSWPIWAIYSLYTWFEKIEN